MASSTGITIDATGPHVPLFADVLVYLQAQYRSIYGSDVNLAADTQDGQFLTLLANAINDCNQGALSAYLSFSPTTAQGVGLSRVVKINGIARLVPSNSTAVVSITGIANTTILNGLVGDNLNLSTQWALPATVTIPLAGTIDVTATCTTPGAITAGAGTLTVLLNPTNGWQTATNVLAATVGAPTESDALLRQRQAASTSLPSLTIQEAVYANVANTAGVTRVMLYDNDTGFADINGVPPHSFSVVAQGGTITAVAGAIAAKKAPGSGTYGTTSVAVLDSHGVSNTINYFIMTPVTITVTLTVKALAGYISATTTPLIASSIAQFISTLSIGETSYLNRLFAPANLTGDAAIAVYMALNPSLTAAQAQAQLNILATTYNVTLGTMKQSRTGPPAVADVAIAFNEGAVCAVGNVTVTVT